MWPMQPREHIRAFAKQMIPANAFQSPDKMFAELTGPKREAFVFFLWNEAGKQVDKPLPHVDTAKGPDGIPRLSKLEVVGALKPVGHELVVISMPPAINPNEVVFLALVRRATGVSVFFYERCMGNDHATVSPNEAVLAEVRADGSRLNHGFKEGIDLAAFKTHLGQVLGVSLDGLETSLPPITAAAFAGAGAGAGAGGGGGPKGLGNFLAMAALVTAILPLVLFRVPVLSGILAPIVGPVWRPLDMLLAATVGLCLLIWVYQVHAARRGQTSMSPAMSIVWWFIPVLNFFYGVPATVASAYRGATGSGAGGLVAAWWVFYFLDAIVMRNVQVMMETMPGSLPIDVVNTLFQFGWIINLLAYGLLFVIVKNATSKL